MPTEKYYNYLHRTHAAQYLRPVHIDNIRDRDQAEHTVRRNWDIIQNDSAQRDFDRLVQMNRIKPVVSRQVVRLWLLISAGVIALLYLLNK